MNIIVCSNLLSIKLKKRGFARERNIIMSIIVNDLAVIKSALLLGL